MAENSNLRVGAIVETDQVQAGLATNAESIKKFADGVAVEFTEMSSKTARAMRQVGEDTKLAAQTVGVEFKKVAEASVVYSKAMSQVRAATVLAKDVTVDQTESLALLAAAKERAAAAAMQLAEAEKVATGATEKETFSMHEAKAEIALLGEETGIKVPRHLRGLVASLPGVGTALNLAFGATAVLMLVQILGEVINKIKEVMRAAEEARERQTKLNESFEDLRISGAGSLHALQVKFVELTQGPIAALRAELKGAKEDLIALDFNKSMSGLIGKGKEQADKSVPFYFLGDEGTAKKAADKFLDDFQRELVKLGGENKLGEGVGLLDKEIADSQQALTAALHTQPERIIQGWRDYIETLGNVRRALQQTLEIEKQGNKNKGQELGKLEADAANKAIEIDQKKNAALIRSFAELKKYIDAEERKESTQQAARAKQELKLEEDVSNEELKNWEKKIKAAHEYAQAAAVLVDSELAHKKAASQMERELVENQFKLGALTSQQHLDQLKKILKDEYEAEKESLKKKLDLLEHDPTISATELQKAKQEIRKVEDKYRLDSQKLELQHVTTSQKLYQTLQQSIAQGWKGTINGILQGTQTLAQGVSSLFRNIAASAVGSIIQMGLEWVYQHTIMGAVSKLFHLNAAKNVTAAALAESAVVSTKNVAEITSAAAVAAANAYAFYAWNPPLAGAMAAEAASTVMMLTPMAMFEKGGDVPTDMPAFLHKREMVLPASIADPLRGMLRMAPPAIGPGNFALGATGDGSFGSHRGPQVTVDARQTVQALDGVSVSRVLRRNRTAVAKEVKRAVRISNGRLRG